MNPPDKIFVSPHFTLEEITRSRKALELAVSNTPPLETLITCVRTAQEMEKVRYLLNQSPISTSSWYRSPVVNAAVGSKDTSQHLVGEAVDFKCPKFGTPVEIVRFLFTHLESYDQLILEHDWVHISFAIRTGQNRRQVLSLLASGGYAQGITNRLGNPI
jgi:zinc D-Ala-D-Ala carboxypeptidase